MDRTELIVTQKDKNKMSQYKDSNNKVQVIEPEFA